jgi:hypothetical protein
MSRLVAAVAFVGLAPVAHAGPFLTTHDLERLSADTKEKCLVAAEVFSMGMGVLEGDITIETWGGELTTKGVDGGLTAMSGDRLAFINVPKGPFRVSHIQYYWDHPTDSTRNEKSERREFNSRGQGRSMASLHGVGEIPAEMSGTCEGGFVWLGIFKGDKGGMLSNPRLFASQGGVEETNALASLKKSLAGTPWAAQIDNPKKPKPLAKDFDIAAKAGEEKAAKATVTAVAAIVSQTHNAAAPPSDAGAASAAAGVYALHTINGKPLPYLFPANKCTMVSGQVELKADQSYTTESNMECAGKKFPFPSSGFFGVVGGVVTYAVKVGALSPGMVTKVAADGTLTSVAGGDTYVYKRK